MHMTPKDVDIPNISVDNLETTPNKDGPSIGGFQEAVKEATTTSRFGKSFIGLGQKTNLVDNDDVKRGGSFIFYAPRINNMTVNITQNNEAVKETGEQKQKTSFLGPRPSHLDQNNAPV